MDCPPPPVQPLTSFPGVPIRLAAPDRGPVSRETLYPLNSLGTLSAGDGLSLPASVCLMLRGAGR